MARADVVMSQSSTQAVCLLRDGHPRYHTGRLEETAVQRQAGGPSGFCSPGGKHSAQGHSGGDAWEGNSTSSTRQEKERCFSTFVWMGGLARPWGKRLSWQEGRRVLAATLLLIPTHVSTGTYLTDFVFHKPIFGCVNYIPLL